MVQHKTHKTHDGVDEHIGITLDGTFVGINIIFRHMHIMNLNETLNDFAQAMLLEVQDFILSERVALLVGPVACIQGIMDDGAKGAAVHEVAQLAVLVQPLHIVHIELQRTADVVLEGTRRQVLAAFIIGIARVQVPQRQPFSARRLDADGRGLLHIQGHLDTMQLAAIDNLQLSDKAGRLAGTRRLGRTGVVNHRHVLGTVEQAVEVIGHNRLLLLAGRHAMGTPDVVGYE